MGANERLSLQIDGKATGTAEIEKLAVAMNKVVSISDKIGQAKQQGEAKTGFESFPSQIKSLVQDPLASAESAVGSLLGKFGSAGVALGGSLAVITSVVGASLSAARALADMGVQYEAVRIRTGMTTKEIAQFGFAARQTESDISVFEHSMRKLSEGLTDGGAAGKKTREALEELGVKTRGLNGQLLPMSGIFRQISAGLNNVTDPAKRAALAVEALGRAGIESLPVFLKLNEALAHAEELNVVGPSEDQLKKFNAYDDALDDLEEHWKIVKRTFQEGITGKIVLQGAEVVLKILGAMVGEGGGKNVGFLDFPGISDSSRSGTGMDYLRDLSGVDLTKPPTTSNIPPHFPGAPFGLQKGQYYTDPVGNINRSVAAGGAMGARDKAAYEFTLPGATASATDAREKAVKARLAYQDSAGSATADVVAQLRTTWQTAESAAAAYETRVKMISKAEAAHLAILEKMSKMNQEGTGFYHFGSGALETVVSQDDITKVNKKRTEPRLRRAGEYNPQSDESFLGADFAYRDTAPPSLYPSTGFRTHDAGFNITGGALPPGMQQLGTDQAFVSTSADRNKPYEANDKSLNEAYVTGIQDRTARADTKHLAALQAATDIQSRIIELNAGPNGEYEMAMKLSQLRLSSAEEEFKTTRDLLKLDQDRLDVAKQQSMALINLQAKRKGQFEGVAGGLFDAVTGGGGIGNFVKGQALGVGKQLFTNAATETVFPRIDAMLHPGSADRTQPSGTLWDRITKGTILGKDPADKGAALLNTAGISLQTAASQLMGAASALQTGSAGGFNYASSSGGGVGGAYNGTGLSFGGIMQDGMGLGLSLGGIAGLSPSRNNSTSYSGLSGVAGGLKYTGDIRGIATGVSSGPNGSESLSTSERVGGAIGTAGVVIGGTQQAIAGFKRGGGKGAMQGISAITGTAAVLDPEPISKAVLAGVALVTSVVGQMMGDPKQMRQEFIDKTLGNAKFEAPVAKNVAMGTGGGYSDYSAWGDVRSSNLSPYPTGATPDSQWYRNGTYNQVPGVGGTPYGGPQMVVHVAGDVIDPQEFFNRNGVALANTMVPQFGTHTELGMAAARATVGG